MGWGMGTNGTLPRRLSTTGCKIAGTQLKAEVEGLAKEGIVLEKEEVAAVGEVSAATEALRAFDKNGAMPAIDRATDSAVAAFDDALEGMEGGYGNPELLSLTSEERAAGELAATVRRAILPDGTAFVQLPYRQQWAKLEVVGRQLEAHRSDLAALGLEVQTGRLLRWVALYGEKLGVTQSAAPSDAEAQAVDRWHLGWQGLVDVVRYHRRNDEAGVRERLLSPYENQAQAERTSDRGSRKPKKDKGPA